VDDSDADRTSPGVVDPRLLDRFSILRRAQTQRDRQDQHEFVPRVVDRYGLVPAEGRVISLSTAATLWITPGSTGAALSMQRTPARGRGSWFGLTESICSGGLWGLMESLEGRRSLCGLVPDGNTCVRLQLRAGGTRSLPTVEGGVVIDEIELIRAVDFFDAFGSLQQLPC
jgi:hypothetical protein